MTGTKILFLEDDILYQESIKDLLEEEEFIVETCNDGNDFLDKIFDTVYDLYILDLNVPQIDGFELMKILDEYNDTTMKLVLTSRNNTLTQSFHNGCDEYLNKTTDAEELLIRIKTLIKRGYNSYDESIQIAEDINYDLFHKKIYKNKQYIELEIRSLLILDYMIKKRGKFISSVELEKNSYPCSGNSKLDVIRYHIWNLRNILGKDIIESKKSLGYRIKPLVA
jgi:DNA-binding response OmpR family regulator